MPSVSSCLHLEQLRAEHVMTEPRQAVSHELLVAFHSVCTALCQCCACEPPSSTNWSKHSALLIAFGWSFWICLCVCVCCVLSSLPWQQQTNIAVEAAILWKPTVSEIFSQPQRRTATPKPHDALYHPCPHAIDTPDTDDSYLWLPALPKFPSLYCPH